MSKLNPPWTRDELILALDLYFRANPAQTTADDKLIVELSRTLNTLPFHPASDRHPNFRNPTGVFMTLCTFLKFDPSYHGKGLKGADRLGRQIWDQFSVDRTLLATTAQAILSAARCLHDQTSALTSLEEMETFPEGSVVLRLHLVRERNPSLTRRKRLEVIQKNGCLACEACGFNFATTYGTLGNNFAECHHRAPLSALNTQRHSRTSDLAIVCANCHRMLHRARPWLRVDELSKVIAQSRGLPITPPMTQARI